MLGQMLSELAQVDAWLDENVSHEYQIHPMAQDWARIAKIGEEFGEVVDAYISHTGQNPRKPARASMDEVMSELTDVAFTAILAMLHFTKDPALVGKYMTDGNLKIFRRMMEHKSEKAREMLRRRQGSLSEAHRADSAS